MQPPTHAVDLVQGPWVRLRISVEVADAYENIGICGHNWCYLCSGAWTEDENNIPYCEHRPDCPELDPARAANPFHPLPDPLRPAPPQPESQSGVADLPSDDEDDGTVVDRAEEYTEDPAPMNRPGPVRPRRGSYHHRERGLPAPEMHYSRRQEHLPSPRPQRSPRQGYPTALEARYARPQGYAPSREVQYSPRREHHSPPTEMRYSSRQGYQSSSPESQHSPFQDVHPPSPKTRYPTRRGSRRHTGDYPATSAEDTTHFLGKPQAPYPRRAALIHNLADPRFGTPHEHYWDMPAPGVCGRPPEGRLPNITVGVAPSRTRRPSVSRRPVVHIEEREPVRRSTRYVTVEVDRQEAARREAAREYRRPDSGTTYPISPHVSPRRPWVSVPAGPVAPKRLRSAYY